MASFRNEPADPEVKRQALMLLDDGHSAAEVARRLELPASSVRSWKRRAGLAAPPSGASEGDWLDQQFGIGDEAAKLAREAMSQARAEIAAGRPIRAQQAATAGGIAVDKLHQVETRLQTWAASRDATNYKLAAVTAQLVSGVFQAAMSRCELSPDQRDQLTAAFADELRQVSSHPVRTASDVPANQHVLQAAPDTESAAQSVETAPRNNAKGPIRAGGWPTRPVSECSVDEVVDGEVVE